jgi:hypothetical protein
MYDNFRANLNVEGSGAVVAAPDRLEATTTVSFHVTSLKSQLHKAA